MRRMLWIVTLAVCTSVWANAQTIADVAREERAKQKETPKTSPTRSATITKSGNKTTIVITGTAPSEPANTPAPASTAAPAATPATAAAPSTTVTAPTTAPAKPIASAEPPAPTKPEHDEKWWREQFEKARTEVRRAENQAAVAQLELNAANRDFLTRSYDPDGRGPTQISSANAKLDAATKNLEAARAKVLQLEDELRRAGGPAGWAR